MKSQGYSSLSSILVFMAYTIPCFT